MKQIIGKQIANFTAESRVQAIHERPKDGKTVYCATINASPEPAEVEIPKAVYDRLQREMNDGVRGKIKIEVETETRYTYTK